MTKLKPWKRLNKYTRVHVAERHLIRGREVTRCQCRDTDRGLNCGGRSDEAGAGGRGSVA